MAVQLAQAPSVKIRATHAAVFSPVTVISEQIYEFSICESYWTDKYLLSEIRAGQVSHHALTNMPDLRDIPTDKGISDFLGLTKSQISLLKPIKRLNKQQNALDTLQSARPNEIYSQGLEEVRKVISDSLDILVKNTQRMSIAPEDLK